MIDAPLRPSASLTRTFDHHRTLAVLCWLFLLAVPSVPADAQDVIVDTENQIAGIAPRLELEAGVSFLMGFGGACRQDDDQTSCSALLPSTGGQLGILVRPWNHLAFGPVVGYSVKLSRQNVAIGDTPSTPAVPAMGDTPAMPAVAADAGEAATYSRHMGRVALELRWYQKRVSVGGLFVGVQTGVTWLTDTLTRKSNLDKSVTQTAPIFGFAFGGSFLPYRGIGATLAFQSYLAVFPSNGKSLSDSDKQSSYGYGTYGFAGFTLNLATSIAL